MNRQIGDLAIRIAADDPSITLDDLEFVVNKAATALAPFVVEGLFIGDSPLYGGMPEEVESIGENLVGALTLITGIDDDEAFVERLHNLYMSRLFIAGTDFLRKPIFSTPLPKGISARKLEQERRLVERERQQEAAAEKLAAKLQPIWDAAEARAIDTVGALMPAPPLDGRYPAPAPQPYGVSPRGAEVWAAEMLRWLSQEDAVVTQASGDGGVDVITDKYAVSVKNYSGTVPIEEVREILGVGVVMELAPMLFTSGSLTPAALEFSELARMPVFRYIVETAEVLALNSQAQTLLETGF
ncbi:restriction endonuclease [Rhodoglobus vestalii]|uniref:Restriction endonuclease n=1 Tax=Rhodoglobus vestalii TaxID=193384 RepID=A0A8H2PVV4_9MICO|nr:restriction endonuclease [Rhodoglobus vestalii]TQO18535.1 restriction endonuclease [Rhodoglobus vestalii]